MKFALQYQPVGNGLMELLMAVMAAPLPNNRLLVVDELIIANVGGHPAELNDLPLAVLVQRVSSLEPPDRAAPPASARPILNAGGMEDAINWPLDGLLAWRMGGQDMPPYYRNGGRIAAEIAPSETENFYYRAMIACEPGLHVSVSSRVNKPRSLWRLVTLPPSATPGCLARTVTRRTHNAARGNERLLKRSFPRE